MEDLAQVYARALFEVAQERGNVDEVREQLGDVADAVEADRNLATFFFSPYFSAEEKKEGLHKAVQGADESVMNFLELLLEKHRMPVIHRIRREYDALWRAEHKLLPVDVTSAIRLDDELVRSLGEKITEQTGRKVELNAHVDPDLVGGIVLRVGNSIMDASIRNRLEQLRKQVARG